MTLDEHNRIETNVQSSTVDASSKLFRRRHCSLLKHKVNRTLDYTRILKFFFSLLYAGFLQHSVAITYMLVSVVSNMHINVASFLRSYKEIGQTNTPIHTFRLLFVCVGCQKSFCNNSSEYFSNLGPKPEL